MTDLVFRRATAACVALMAATALQACGGSQAGEARSAASTWGKEPNVQGASNITDQPARFDGWRARSRWTSQSRAFERTWSPAIAADGGAFPAGGNACDQSRTLVKWRSLVKGITVRAAWQQETGLASDDPGTPEGGAVTGEHGWMILDGCREPIFSFGKSADDPTVNLVDVVYTVRQYDAAP